MKINVLIAIFALGIGLTACSSSPDADDIKSQLQEGWGQCKGLSFTGLKKTNGIQHEKTYGMAISYKLEILKDVTAHEAWYDEALCPSPGMLQLLWAYGKLDNKFGQALKKGDYITVNDTFEMVKSEKGWISQ